MENLTPAEISFVLHALCAVTRSGGGSFAHSLTRKLAAQHPEVEIDPWRVVGLQQTAASELRDE